MKIFGALFILVCFSLSASNWNRNWAEGVMDYSEGKYSEAEDKFNLAIREIELDENFENFYHYSAILVDRAKLYISLEKYSEALFDLDKAILPNILVGEDLVQALASRINVRSHLGMDKGVLEDLEQFGKVYNRIPVFQNTKDSVIITNLPDCDCAKKIIASYLICLDDSLNKEEVYLLKSSIMIIKRHTDCQVPEKKFLEFQFCNECKKNAEFANHFKSSLLTCDSWCDANAITAAGWCSKVFKRPDCATACYAAVYVIQRGCHRCCSEGDFYKKCIEPFGQVLDYMDITCKPYKD